MIASNKQRQYHNILALVWKEKLKETHERSKNSPSCRYLEHLNKPYQESLR